MNGKWDLEGIAEVAKIILNEENPLFQSLTGKLAEYKGVRKLIYRLLFQGEKIVYNPDDPEIGMARMLGFLKVVDGNIYIANRIFETRLYNMFLSSTEDQDTDTYREGLRLILKPIINGTGNYYIEARTRNDERTDMIIDYLGHQYVIEMKIWRGNAYNERGES